MLFIGPVPVVGIVFTIAFAWNVILLHTQVTHLHRPERFQPRFHFRMARRSMGVARQSKYGDRLVVRNEFEPAHRKSPAEPDRSTRGRKAAPAVRIHVHQLCEQSRDLPRKPGWVKRHCQIRVRTSTHRPSKYPRPLPRLTPYPGKPAKGTVPGPRDVPYPTVNTPPTTSTSSDRQARRARLYRRLKIHL